MTALSRAVALAAALLLVPATAVPQDAGAKPPDAKPADAKPAGGEKKAPEPPKPPTLEEVKEFCKQYEDSLKKMTDEDAIAGVEKSRGWFANPGTADDAKKEIVGLMKKVLEAKSRESLLEAACKALGDFGDDGVVLLKYAVDRAMGQKVPTSGVIRAGLPALGKIASPKTADVKFLTDLLKKEDEFIGDAANALAGYGKAPGSVRRDIFEELLKMSEGVFSKSEANDQPAKRRWNIWGTDVVEALQKVSRQNWQKPTEFRKWFNDKGEKGGKNPKAWADDPPPAPKPADPKGAGN